MNDHTNQPTDDDKPRNRGGRPPGSTNDRAPRLALTLDDDANDHIALRLRYAIPDHLAEEAHRVFMAALAEIGKKAELTGLEVQGHPIFWGTPGIDEYRASTIARLAVGVEPLPDFETFYVYSTTV